LSMDGMSMGATDVQSLSRKLLRLNQDLTAIEDKLDIVQDPVEERRLETQKQGVIANITQIEQEMDGYKSNPTKTQFRQIVTHWDGHIHKLDRVKGKKMTSTVLKKLEDSTSGASLFLFQNYDKFLGKRYVEYLKKSIDSSDLGHFSKPYQIGFCDGQPRPIDFLNNLGEQLDIDLLPSQELSIDLIFDRIELSLAGCNIFFIEVNLPEIEEEHEFISWFFDVFWSRLLERKAQFSCSSVVCIGVVTLESDFGKEFLRDRSCTVANLVQDRFLVLPEEKWKESDIRDWITKFSKLLLTADQIEKISRSVCRTAEGIPFGSEVKLLQELERLAG
jgi:hypothetical protein